MVQPKPRISLASECKHSVAEDPARNPLYLSAVPIIDKNCLLNIMLVQSHKALGNTQADSVMEQSKVPKWHMQLLLRLTECHTNS